MPEPKQTITHDDFSIYLLNINIYLEQQQQWETEEDLKKHVLFELDEDEIIDDINFGEVNAKYYPNLRGYYSHEIKGNWFDSGIWT